MCGLLWDLYDKIGLLSGIIFGFAVLNLRLLRTMSTVNIESFSLNLLAQADYENY